MSNEDDNKIVLLVGLILFAAAIITIIINLLGGLA